MGHYFFENHWQNRTQPVPETHGDHMRSMLIRLIFLAVASQLIFSCGMIGPANSVANPTTLQNQRVTSAGLALLELSEIDALVKLNNRQLTRQIITGLKAQASSTGDFYFRKLKIRFDSQFIALQSTIDIADNRGNVITASVTGDILLDYSGNRLSWFPFFDRLHVNSTNFSFEGVSYAAAMPEFNASILQRLNTDITNALMLHDNNTIPLEAVPLAELEVGTSLLGPGNATASRSQPLKGVFVVAGSAILIEADVTTIALDLNFISDLSTCPADIEVSRAVFAGDIKSREPVFPVRNMTSSENLRFFYSEISGAKRPMTIIHYWFADGQPIAVQELAVGPSERWRTWSAKGRANTGASHWEVLVVEKESGCILHSQSVHTLAAEGAVPQADKTRASQTFAALRSEFNARTAGFSISKDKPKIALVETRRAFMQDVFNAAMADLRIETEFDQNALSQLQFAARMLPFETRDIICEQRYCPSPRACTASVTQCKRLRDTRDCSSCLFYNPLNNRCVSQAVDPICEAARNRQNAKFDADREDCIANAAAKKLDCEQLNTQAARSCEIESGIEVSACKLIKTGIEALPGGTALAGVRAGIKTRGKLSTVFSGFRIEDDFSRLKLDMSLKSDLEVTGKLQFSPGNIPTPLKVCIDAWSAPFTSRVLAVASVDRILANIEIGKSALTAYWSGFTMPLTMTPSPLESVFVSDHQLLASCGIGLTVKKVERLIASDDADFFSGQMKLEIQPLPTRIRLSPATVVYGGQSYRAEAVLGKNFLRYDIGE